MKRFGALLLSGGMLSASGCLARTLPIPPPGATFGAQNCDVSTCGADGIAITVTGDARAGALIVVENQSRQFIDGTRYTAAAYAQSLAPPPDGGLVLGSYSVYLGPVPQPNGPTLLSQEGDRIVVFQLIRLSDGTWEASSTCMWTLSLTGPNTCMR